LVRLEREVGKKSTIRPDKTKRQGNRVGPRIAYLRATPGPGTQAGGAASHIKGVVKALTELGASVDVISNDQIAGFDESRIPVVIVEPESVGGTRALFDIHNNLVFTRAVVPLVQDAQPDLIYQRYARFSWVGIVAALRTNLPLFLEYNGSEVWVARYWDRVGRLDLLARYELLNLRAASRIFVVSDVERQNLERSGVPPEKIIVNPNGVDVELFRPSSGGDDVRRKFQIEKDEIVAGFVGTFGPWHGVLTLADAIKLLPQDPKLKFLLVGAGSLLGDLRSILKEEEECGRVIFTGPVKHEEVPALLDACDILVAPHIPLTDGSQFFGSPTKLFEYMAMGKGIVASRLGQIGDVLVDEETALLVAPGDAGELAAAIVRLAQSREMRQRLGANARQVAIERHTWRHNAQRVLDAYAQWKEEKA
jgi:glycosyltransferase involved in cell wall biosynthesis